MLFKMLVVSLLLHALVIYLVPSVDIFVSLPQYIEVETFLGVGGEDEVQPQAGEEVVRELAATDIEPLAPEIPARLQFSRGRNGVTPEQRDHLPQALETVKPAQPVKPALTSPEPDMPGPRPAHSRDVEKGADIPFHAREQEAVFLDDAATVAEQPYERREQHMETPPQIERPPDFMIRDTFELAANVPEERHVAPVIPSRQPIQAEQPVVQMPRFSHTEEPERSDMAPVRLPEAKDIPQPAAEDELFIKEEPVKLAGAEEQQTAEAFFEHPLTFPVTKTPRVQQNEQQNEPAFPISEMQERRRTDFSGAPPVKTLPQDMNREKIAMRLSAERQEFIPEVQEEFSPAAPLDTQDGSDRKDEEEQRQEDALRPLPTMPLIRQTVTGRKGEDVPELQRRRAPAAQTFQQQTPDVRAAQTLPEKTSPVPVVNPLAPDIAAAQEHEESVLQAETLSFDLTPQKGTARKTQDAADALAFPQRRAAKPAVSSQQDVPIMTTTQRTALFGKNRVEMSEPPGKKAFGLFVKPSEQKEEPQPEFEAPKQELTQEDSVEKVDIEKEKPEAAALTIEGPASGRAVISKPVNPPRVNIEREVTIRLKFWVLPDGSVGDVIPLQRGDVRLERAAIEYLKGWRFTPAKPGSPMVWGIIPITYRLK